jgi:RAB protein geranylgeranyltransferase component A
MDVHKPLASACRQQQQHVMLAVWLQLAASNRGTNGDSLLCCAACSDGCYISTGYDATTHFETTVDDVLDIYKRITGHDIDLNSKNPRLAQQQE